MTGFWDFEDQMPYKKYQQPPTLVRYPRLLHLTLEGCRSHEIEKVSNKAGGSTDWNIPKL